MYNVILIYHAAHTFMYSYIYIIAYYDIFMYYV